MSLACSMLRVHPDGSREFIEFYPPTITVRLSDTEEIERYDLAAIAEHGDNSESASGTIYPPGTKLAAV